MQKDTSTKEASGLLAGLDEVGMGCLAGPVCICVVAFPSTYPPIPGVKDSKKLTAKKREELAPIIMKAASFCGVGWCSPQIIDSMGLAYAWQQAAWMALEGAPKFDHLMIDGERAVQGYTKEQTTYIKGDARFWQISAASIVAKVSRDRDMMEMAKVYPAYGFQKHMGYGTKAHMKQIRLAGVSPYHRVTFLKKMRARDKAPVP
jgi:ribonuclease HII